MAQISVEVPTELLDDLNDEIGDNAKFVSQSEAVRTAIRKLLDQMNEVDRMKGRIDGDN